MSDEDKLQLLTVHFDPEMPTSHALKPRVVIVGSRDPIVTDLTRMLLEAQGSEVFVAPIDHLYGAAPERLVSLPFKNPFDRSRGPKNPFVERHPRGFDRRRK